MFLKMSSQKSSSKGLSGCDALGHFGNPRAIPVGRGRVARLRGVMSCILGGD